MATREEHFGCMRWRHEVVAHSARVRLQLLGKASFQHGSRLQLIAEVLLLLTEHLILQLMFQSLSNFLSYPIDVAAATRSQLTFLAHSTCILHSLAAAHADERRRRHLWLTASGMGRLVDIAPTRDARMGSRVDGIDAEDDEEENEEEEEEEAAVEEGRGASTAVVVKQGAACTAADDLVFDGGCCCPCLMLPVYLQCGLAQVPATLSTALLTYRAAF